MGRRMLMVWDEVLRDARLAARLEAEHERFHLIDRETFFWYPRRLGEKGNPKNPIEEMAEIVIETVAPPSLAGVEYWSNSLAVGAHMHFHQDKDEGLYWRSKELRHPLIGTVYYPAGQSFTGGELVVDRKHLISPGPNCLVAFHGDAFHGVQKVKTGTRRSIALNLWAVTPINYEGT